jgi:D-ribose pyranase
MLQNGILNPHLLDLVARVRHTNTLVIADWAFPFWPEIETVDISLIRGLPTVLDVLKALQPNFKVGRIWQAREFLTTNPAETVHTFDRAFAAFADAEVERLPHLDFKGLVPDAIGLIRTGDTTAYGNVILQSV